MVWQSEHPWVVGMWLAGFDGVAKVVVVWHCEQSPVGGWVAVTGRVTMVTPKKLFPFSWQLAHVIEATGAWFIAVPENVVNLLGEWQASQATPVYGMCFAGGDTGTTFANVSPGPWHCAQFDAIPWWFITAFE